VASKGCRDRPYSSGVNARTSRSPFHDQPKRDCLHPAGGDAAAHLAQSNGLIL